MIFASSTQRVQYRAIEWLARMESSAHSPADEARFFEWLAQSPLHQAAYIEAESLWQKGEILNHPSCVRASSKSIVESFATMLTWQPVIACALLTMITLGSGLFLLAQSTHQQERYEFQTALGEWKQFQLNDGSTITLNTGSHVSVALERSQRNITLHKGEAIFDVARDRERPFTVNTRQGSVHVLGTKFNILDAPDKVEVTVFHGRVGLAPNTKKMPTENVALFEPEITLQANQQLSIAEAEQGMNPREVDAKLITAWQNGRLVYHGTPLAQVVADINRYYASQLVLEDAALGKREVVAVIKLGNFDQTVSALSSTLQLSASEVGKSNGGGRLVRLHPTNE